jgi:hypothetical protein
LGEDNLLALAGPDLDICPLRRRLAAATTTTACLFPTPCGVGTALQTIISWSLSRLGLRLTHSAGGCGLRLLLISRRLVARPHVPRAVLTVISVIWSVILVMSD